MLTLSTCRRVSIAVLALVAVLVGAAASVAQNRRAAVPPAAGGVQIYTSNNFRVVTDLDAKEAAELLDRLETMLKFVSAYFGKKNIRTIDMYVARDIDAWPAGRLAKMDPDGIAMIRGGAGVTQIATALINGRPVDAQAVVYAVADHGTPQHEAVHAYCGLAFGAAGPVWYAEGMAEVGQYWKAGDKGVNAVPQVLEYLRESEPKPLDEIVDNPLETTGDSWQNYAWRWALCHLLGYNTNYTDRFKPLGLALLNRQDVDFWQVYGSQAAEIGFEYQFFLKHVEAGYRVDLCSWDWKSKSAAPDPVARAARSRPVAGGKCARVKLKAGETYTYEASGDWSCSPDGPDLTCDGDETGSGRLVGCLYQEFTLTEEFDLGVTGTFTAPAEGTLYLRCRDAWGSVADNQGSVTFKMRPGM